MTVCGCTKQAQGGYATRVRECYILTNVAVISASGTATRARPDRQILVVEVDYTGGLSDTNFASLKLLASGGERTAVWHFTNSRGHYLRFTIPTTQVDSVPLAFQFPGAVPPYALPSPLPRRSFEYSLGKPEKPSGNLIQAIVTPDDDEHQPTPH